MRILKCKAIMPLERAIFKYRVRQGMAGGKVLTSGIGVPLHCSVRNTLSEYLAEAGAGAVQDEIMVIALAKFDLLVVRINPWPDRGGLAEIDRGAGDLTKFAGRDQRALNKPC